MGIQIFLGKPPASVERWIKDHAAPAEHPETRFTLSDGTVKTHDITGTLDKQWMIDNGYFDDEDYVWIKAITQADIGNTVTSIGDWAFSGCSGLTSVTIPASVTSIGDYAFSNCSGLTSVTIGDGVTSIGKDAFYGCSGLTSVTIGNSVTSIGDYAFYDCRGLTSVTIPDSVTSIGDQAFWDCSGLTSVTIPDSVTSIEGGAFEGCSSLTSVTIPDSVTSIGYAAFYGCSGLTSVTFNSFTKNEVKSMTTSDYIFGETFYDDQGNPMEKSFTAVCTNGSMTVHFSADYSATITFTDL